ncbi:MAG: alpha/beta hydrolase [Erythrobacter sp.]|uniref:alpha/beta hydrolase n=1 Tax=Erythrobacter sp. TaxID=1042 RepID=UPI0026281F90|nr:alpha/beta hydrolase [Erythrobacter sp.]MDJ0979336.1 alpha/beta hydrolase [Erythrobacter sp.]
MRWILAFGLLLQALALSAPAHAQHSAGHRSFVAESWVEEWDPSQRRWVRLDEARLDNAGLAKGDPIGPSSTTQSTPRFAPPEHASGSSDIARRYGPFLVLSDSRAALIGSTDSASPRQFEALMRDYPGLQVLEMIEAPGTYDDIANLALGRRLRAAGITTYVPRGGSVRSGAVELFLAGASRRIENGARFAVHSWLDSYGREPSDFAADAPANRLYIDYYIEMGMSEKRARAFYAMTNSVPHHSAKWLGAKAMRRWLEPEKALAAFDPGKAEGTLAMSASQAPETRYGDGSQPGASAQAARPRKGATATHAFLDS